VNQIDEKASRQGHGWWPYLLPYISFLLLVELAGRLPDGFFLPMLFIKPAVPLGLIVYYWRAGAYPELRGEGLDAKGALSDVAVGLGLAALWVAPYVVFPSLRPDPADTFDAAKAGVSLVPLVLCVRMFGYAIVTPLFEEVFIRSFVMRYSDVYWERGDFRDVPLARYTSVSFISTIVVFTIGHVPWEWWVAVPWVALTNLWFYHRRNLWALVLTHGVTNAALLVLALYGGGLFDDGQGNPLSLWFFV
jgi:CAAX prenyl protease-like protein